MQDGYLGTQCFFSQKSVYIANGGAVGSVYGGGSTGEGHIFKVCLSLELLEVGYQKLSAPDATIGALTGTIEGDPNHRLLNPIVHQATDNVGMVVLNAD